jgi:hypothetical protein
MELIILSISLVDALLNFILGKGLRYFRHGVNTAIQEPGLLGSGSQKFETVKHGHESSDTGIRERVCWRDPAATV